MTIRQRILYAATVGVPLASYGVVEAVHWLLHLLTRTPHGSW